MPAKRRLSDLYTVGKYVEIDDGNGPVKVWLQKLNPVENGNIIRFANAARARLRAVKRDKESPEYLDMLNEVLEWQDAGSLVEYIAGERILILQEIAEAKVAAEEEWSKDAYIQGLRDAWAGGLRDTYAVTPEDPEAKRVFQELERFSKAANEISDPEIEELRGEISTKPLEKLQEEALDRIISYRANAAWLDEFHKGELLYGVRDPDDHRVYYFDRDELDRLSAQVLTTLLNEYATLSVDVVEGKDSGETPTSSPSSEQSAEVGTQAFSGLVAVAP